MEKINNWLSSCPTARASNLCGAVGGANLQTRFRVQRGHLGIPAVVVDGVSLRHPQHRVLPQRERREQDGKPDPSVPNGGPAEDDIIVFSLEYNSILQPGNQTLILYTDDKRSWSSVMEENGLQFNYFCSVIPIYPRVIKFEARYFPKNPGAAAFYEIRCSSLWSHCSQAWIEMFWGSRFKPTTTFGRKDDILTACVQKGQLALSRSMTFPGNTSHFRLWCLMGVEPLKNEHMGSHLSTWCRDMRKTEQRRM